MESLRERKHVHWRVKGGDSWFIHVQQNECQKWMFVIWYEMEWCKIIALQIESIKWVMGSFDI
jgi:hypothetical protein